MRLLLGVPLAALCPSQVSHQRHCVAAIHILQWISGYPQHGCPCTSYGVFWVFLSFMNHPGMLYMLIVSHTNSTHLHVTTCDITKQFVCRSSGCQQCTLALYLGDVHLCTPFLHSVVNWVHGCAEAQPVVTLIPGSVEQRGQVFRTSHGDPPFCRLLLCSAISINLKHLLPLSDSFHSK